ncbi:MAG: hypothetical protein NC191_02050 [Muribaculaceae bacterium]|nr:hypothetical protein [Muribaculaceae bacterium]
MKKFITFAILILSSTAVFAQDTTQWHRVCENNYINPDGIVGTTDFYGFSFILKSYNKGQYEPVNGNEILYTLSNYTVDCGKMKYKIGTIDSYGVKDNFVNGDYNRFATFQPIAGGTAVSEVAKKLCRP